MVIELEEMSEEQLGKLQAFLRSAIAELENEVDWREAEDEELLPILRGITRYVAREYLNEEETTHEFEYNYDDGGPDLDGDYGELDF